MPYSYLLLRHKVLYITYQERLREWPCEALATSFILKKGANSSPGEIPGTDKSDQAENSISL